MKITACPNCGSRRVGTGGIRDGVVPHEFLKQACKDCGWSGYPLEFDNEQNYQNFLKGLKVEEQNEKDVFYDPAEKAPYQRFILRSLLTHILFLLILIIPACVFLIVSVIGDFPTEVGFIFAILSFILYLYIFLKKELWNLIKR